MKLSGEILTITMLSAILSGAMSAQVIEGGATGAQIGTFAQAARPSVAVPSILRIKSDTWVEGLHGEVNFTSPSPFTVAGALLKAEPSWPWVVVKAGTATDSAGFAVYNSADTALFQVFGTGRAAIAGRVTIGPPPGTTPHLLDIIGAPVINPVGPGGMRETLALYDSTDMVAEVGAGVAFGGKYTGSGGYAQQFASIQGFKENGTSGDYAGALRFYTRANGGNPVERMRITSNGTVQITGDVVTSGNIAAKYQDVAEWVPAGSDLEPGTVVVLDAVLRNSVIASQTAYDTMVAGVVSTQPGIILGEGGASKEQIATTGRVRVKVDATAAPIRIGDLLVTSEKTGYAMRSIPVQVSGISMHRPGTIVGKALEPLTDGEGEILVLLSLQ
jgi:hypothetical protein